MLNAGTLPLLAPIARQRKASAQPKATDPNAAEERFAFHCRGFKLPPFIQQFKLTKSVQVPRKDGKNIPNAWRFDFAFPEQQLIVEIDGGVWMAGGGAHSHPVDITRNMAKGNDAAAAGFVILRFSPKEVRSGHAVDFTLRVLAARGWVR